MNRTAVRILLLLSVVCAIFAAYHSVQAQRLGWPDAQPGTSKIQWYGSAILPYAVWALVLGFAAIRPDKTGGTVLIVAAALFWLVLRPRDLSMALVLFMAGMTLRRMASSQHA